MPADVLASVWRPLRLTDEMRAAAFARRPRLAEAADALDRTAQLAAASYATLDDVAVALRYEVSFLTTADDRST